MFYWLCYRHADDLAVVIEDAPSLIQARIKADMTGLGEGEFAEGHELPKTYDVPQRALGRRLSLREAAAALLNRWDRPAKGGRGLMAAEFVDGFPFSDDELEQIRQAVEAFDTVDAISDELRGMIERKWPHLVPKLPSRGATGGGP